MDFIIKLALTITNCIRNIKFAMIPLSSTIYGLVRPMCWVLLIVLFFLWFPCVRARQVDRSLRSTATFLICFHWSLLLAFSLHFSSSSAFLRSLFTQSSHLNCGLLRFLKPSCFFVSALFSNLSSFVFHSGHMSSLFFQLYKLWLQLLLLGLPFSFFPLSLLRLFSLSSCPHINVVNFDAVRTQLTYHVPTHFLPT